MPLPLPAGRSRCARIVAILFSHSQRHSDTLSGLVLVHLLTLFCAHRDGRRLTTDDRTQHAAMHPKFHSAWSPTCSRSTAPYTKGPGSRRVGVRACAVNRRLALSPRSASKASPAPRVHDRHRDREPRQTCCVRRARFFRGRRRKVTGRAAGT